WLWDFDDPYASTIEKTSSLQSPVHTYLKAGKFYPKLTASNSQGSNIKVYSDGVYIRHTRPTAAFSASPTTGYAPFSVNFTDQSIGQALTAWEWNFGDGGLSDIQSPVYTFNKPGNWSVTFRSYNDGGWSDPIIKENLITVIVTPVTAGFVGSPVSGSSPLTVSFTDQSMGNPTNWSWDFGDSTTPSTLQSPQHIYLNEGNYTVKLTASKVVEGITYSNVITKENYIHAGFAIQPAFTGTPTSGLTPLPVQFTDQSTGSPTSWFWDFGDGQYSSVQNPSHTYISTGSFPVTLTISKLGLSQSLSKPAYIQVGVSPFNADFEADQTVGLKPLTVDFTDETTGSPLPTQWTWSFGDGGSSIAQNPTHIYTQAGSYTVTLTARNEGQTSTKEKQNYITVTSEPTPPPVDPSKIELKTGWNFVSTPKTLASGSNTGMIFSGVNMGGRSAWIWDGSMSPPQWVPVISTTPIRPLWGIWIYSTSSTVVNLNFDPASQSLPPLRNLPAGWNGIGFTGVTQQPARNTYLSVKPNWTTSMGFNAATQKYDPTIFNGDPQTEFTLQYPTKGYWLYMMTPGNLSAIGV
ncbi:MAG: PKD domain-containing protein, partial [Methanomicrobiales archaeon]